MAQVSKKVRIFELAKTLNLESKLIIDHCRDLGYDVKNQLSSLETDQVDAVKSRISKGARPSAGNSAPPPRPTAQPVAPAKIDKKIVALPVPKSKVETSTPEPEPEVVHEVEPDFVAPEPMLTAPEPEPVVETAKPIAKPVLDVPSGRVPTLSKPKPIVTPVVESVPEPTPEPITQTAPPAVAEVVVEPVRVVEPTPEPVVTPTAVEAKPEPIPTPEPTPTATVPAPQQAPAYKQKVDLPRPMNLSGPRGIAQVKPPQVRPPAQTRPPVASGTTTGPAPTQNRPATTTTTPSAGQTPNTGGPNVGAHRPNTTTPPAGGAARPPFGTGGNPPPRTGASPPPNRPNSSVRPPNLSNTPTNLRVGPPGTAGGAPGQAGQPPRTGDRNRRDRDQRPPGNLGPRQPGQQTLRAPGQGPGPVGQRPGQQTPGGNRPGQQTPAAPPPSKIIRFSPEELEKIRSGKTVAEIKKEAEQLHAPKPGIPVVDEAEDEDKGRKGPGGKGTPVGSEKDRRAKERQIRTEQRKVKTKDVVIGTDGQVDVENENFGSKHGRRAALLKKQKMRQLKGTLERKGKVPITMPITVRSLCEAIGMKSVELLFKLKDLTNSLFTINSTVDVEVAELIAVEKGVELDIQKPKSIEDDLFEEHKEAAEDESKLEPRAPVVTIMGHVDHGKTSLLDRIRKNYGLDSNVVATEAGGITQVIRAWRVEKDGKPITFLDTPGHEAFTKMRARGANVTDIAVIVVAADSGVQPQTEEAVAHAKAAGVSIVVAINKIDMPGADPVRVERQLYNLNLLPDNMGGDVQFIRTSAVKGTGIDELLETLALVAEIKDLKANSHKSGQGTCLEAYLSGDEGVMATFLVQQGTLKKGDVLVCGATYGRVRAMYDDLGRPISSAGPSVPVRITGLDQVPNADDHFHVVPDLAKAREIAETRKIRQAEAGYNIRQAVKLDTLTEAKAKITELKVILKAEARGSVEAIRKELEKLVHDEVRVRVLHAGIGAITESDVQLALASPEDTLVVGFNVVPDNEAIHLAEARDIPIREYNIIYKLTEDIKQAMEGKLKPEERVIHLGRALVRETFKISKVGTVAGCYVTQGNIERSAKIRLIREGVVVFPQGERIAGLDSLKRFKDDVREVKEGYDCGIKLAGYDDIKVGDVIEAYRIEQVKRTL